MMNNVIDIIKNDLDKLRKIDDIERKFKYFHKTDAGGYAEKDQFIGVTVPDIRIVAKQFYKEITFEELEVLLHSIYHEYRLTALIILTYKMNDAVENEKKEIVNFYIKNTNYINGWDLVDLSAHYILGKYLMDKEDRKILYEFANSKDIWERRIAIVSTWIMIRNKQYDDTIKISKILIKDKEDLIQKAVGWMLREVGKSNFDLQYNFMKENYKIMPRMMLRYAIEKYPEDLRKSFLTGNI